MPKTILLIDGHPDPSPQRFDHVLAEEYRAGGAGRAGDLSTGGALRWMYRSDRPNGLAMLLNRFFAVVHRLGIAPDYLVTLEVVGRTSGKTIRLPLVMAIVDDRRYLMSTLGEDVAWVRNVRAAHGDAVLMHGRREAVNLEEVPADRRAPILKAYLQRAPGARPHIPVDKDAPIERFEEIAAQYLVFCVERKIGSCLT